MSLWRQRGYGRFWAADAVSMFGTHVTTLALQVLAVVTLHASATQLGVLNAAGWVPYLLFGLLPGVVVDRRSGKAAQIRMTRGSLARPMALAAV